ncbi:MAG: UDP-N-acetylglucosamine 1-carboxyvinyltransferase [Minisyncoccia bacterium]
MKKPSEPNPHEKIGYLIKELRQRKNLTQSEFATLLKTSQSAVARIEKGDQNLSTEQILKISDVLNHRIMSIKEGTDFQVIGGKKLHGSFEVNTSKNGALGLMCGALVNKGTTTLHGIPRIEEIARMVEVLRSIGVTIEYVGEHTLRITPPKKFNFSGMAVASAQKMRSIVTTIGALIHTEKRFAIPHAGGCNMGERTIEAHKHALRALGVSIETKHDEYVISHTTLEPATIIMFEASDTAAISALLASARVPGVTTIKYAPPNYMVQDVCFLLERLGVSIEGIGSTTLKVHGVADIDMNVEHYNSEDPVEAMMCLSAAATTNSKLTITRAPIEFLEVELLKLEYMGLKFSVSKPYMAKNERTTLVDITTLPSSLVASPVKIHPLPYPGLNIDNLPFFVPIASQAEGTTLIHDWTWENRAIYFTELNRLGADVRLADPHRVFVTGPRALKGAQVVSPPALRPAMIVLIAMLAAEGTSILRNVYSIERGYERIAERLSAIGAKVDVIKDL